MPIKIGSTNINNIYMGNNSIEKGYIGTDLFYIKAPTFTEIYSRQLTQQTGTVYSIIELTDGNLFCAGDSGRWNRVNTSGGSLSNGVFSGQSGDIRALQKYQGMIFAAGSSKRYNLISETGSTIYASGSGSGTYYTAAYNGFVIRAGSLGAYTIALYLQGRWITVGGGTLTGQTGTVYNAVPLVENGDVFFVGSSGRWNKTSQTGGHISNGVSSLGVGIYSATRLDDGNIFCVGQDGYWVLFNIDGVELNNGRFEGQNGAVYATIQLSDGSIFSAGYSRRWNLTTSDGVPISNGVISGQTNYIYSAIQLDNGNIVCVGNGGRLSIIKFDY